MLAVAFGFAGKVLRSSMLFRALSMLLIFVQPTLADPGTFVGNTMQARFSIKSGLCEVATNFCIAPLQSEIINYDLNTYFGTDGGIFDFYSDEVGKGDVWRNGVAMKMSDGTSTWKVSGNRASYRYQSSDGYVQKLEFALKAGRCSGLWSASLADKRYRKNPASVSFKCRVFEGRHVR